MATDELKKFLKMIEQKSTLSAEFEKALENLPHYTESTLFMENLEKALENLSRYTEVSPETLKSLGKFGDEILGDVSNLPLSTRDPREDSMNAEAIAEMYRAELNTLPLNVRLPEGFDKNDPQHREAVYRSIRAHLEELWNGREV